MVKHLVSIGGGITSTIELPLVVLERYGAENVDFVIAALRGEHPDTWRMVNWLQEKTGKTVTKVSWVPDKELDDNGELVRYKVNAPENEWADIWDVFFHVKLMGSSLFDPCSNQLKRKTLRNYIKNTYGKDVVLHLGITYDERHRMKAISNNWWGKDGILVKADLVQSSRHDKRTKNQRSLETLGFIPELYALEFPHNNCGGFCVKAGQGQMAKLLWYYPELYKYHESRELEFQQMMKESGSKRWDFTIMRRTVKGVRYGVTLQQLRFEWEAKWAGQETPPFEDFYEAYNSACLACEAIG